MAPKTTPRWKLDTPHMVASYDEVRPVSLTVTFPLDATVPGLAATAVLCHEGAPIKFINKTLGPEELGEEGQRLLDAVMVWFDHLLSSQGVLAPGSKTDTPARLQPVEPGGLGMGRLG